MSDPFYYYIYCLDFNFADSQFFFYLPGSTVHVLRLVEQTVQFPRARFVETSVVRLDTAYSERVHHHRLVFARVVLVKLQSLVVADPHTVADGVTVAVSAKYVHVPEIHAVVHHQV